MSRSVARNAEFQDCGRVNEVILLEIASLDLGRCSSLQESIHGKKGKGDTATGLCYSDLPGAISALIRVQPDSYHSSRVISRRYSDR